MWYFSAPHIVFGEGALEHLSGLVGQGAFIVSDATLERLGWVERVRAALQPTGMAVHTFTAVEPDPSLETARRGAEAMRAAAPDWIIALGGGSVIDAAKAMWVLYERPDLIPEAINPIEPLGLRQKARLIAVPTTTGTGSEATWAIVLTDPAEQRKLGLGSREALPDIALLDPALVAELPARLAADTGLDALTHAVEGYTSTWHNDFSDGLCLHAARLVFETLPTAAGIAEIAAPPAERAAALARLQNAASIAGMGFGNSMAALAHGIGHALGSIFHIPHGRAVALALPYTIEWSAAEPDPETAAAIRARCADLLYAIRRPCPDETRAPHLLADAVRDLSGQVGQPLTLCECGISRAEFEQALDQLVDHALGDSQTIMAARIPDSADLRELLIQMYG